MPLAKIIPKNAVTLSNGYIVVNIYSTNNFHFAS